MGVPNNVDVTDVIEFDWTTTEICYSGIRLEQSQKEKEKGGDGKRGS